MEIIHILPKSQQKNLRGNKKTQDKKKKNIVRSSKGLEIKNDNFKIRFGPQEHCKAKSSDLVLFSLDSIIFQPWANAHK